MDSTFVLDILLQNEGWPDQIQLDTARKPGLAAVPSEPNRAIVAGAHARQCTAGQFVFAQVNPTEGVHLRL